MTVLDSYCDRGIGTILLTSLVEAARARGITTFTASVLWENEELLDSLRAYGAVVVPDEPGVAAVSVGLPRDRQGVRRLGAVPGAANRCSLRNRTTRCEGVRRPGVTQLTGADLFGRIAGGQRTFCGDAVYSCATFDPAPRLRGLPGGT